MRKYLTIFYQTFYRIEFSWLVLKLERNETDYPWSTLWIAYEIEYQIVSQMVDHGMIIKCG